MTTNSHSNCDHPATKKERALCRRLRTHAASLGIELKGNPVPRYYVHDRSKGQAAELVTFNHMNPRYGIIDRHTEKTVDDANSSYEARQAVRNWNAGVYDA